MLKAPLYVCYFDAKLKPIELYALVLPHTENTQCCEFACAMERLTLKSKDICAASMSHNLVQSVVQLFQSLSI